jgi:hypothetical protein
MWIGWKEMCDVGGTSPETKFSPAIFSTEAKPKHQWFC